MRVAAGDGIFLIVSVVEVVVMNEPIHSHKTVSMWLRFCTGLLVKAI